MIRIEFQRGNLKALLIGLPLTGFFAVASILGALWPEKYLTNGADNSTGAWIASGCACMFGGAFLLLLLGIPLMLRKRGIDFDQRGITYWDGQARMFLPWQHIAAVGVGFMRSPAPGQMVKMNQGHALEIYPAPHAAPQDKLAAFLVAEQPPRPGLSEQRYRILLPPFDGATQQVETAVRTYAPHLWLGVYQRAWHRTPGR